MLSPFPLSNDTPSGLPGGRGATATVSQSVDDSGEPDLGVAFGPDSQKLENADLSTLNEWVAAMSSVPVTSSLPLQTGDSEPRLVEDPLVGLSTKALSSDGDVPTDPLARIMRLLVVTGEPTRQAIHTDVPDWLRDALAQVPKTSDTPLPTEQAAQPEGPTNIIDAKTLSSATADIPLAGGRPALRAADVSTLSGPTPVQTAPFASKIDADSLAVATLSAQGLQKTDVPVVPTAASPQFATGPNPSIAPIPSGQDIETAPTSLPRQTARHLPSAVRAPLPAQSDVGITDTGSRYRGEEPLPVPVGPSPDLGSLRTTPNARPDPFPKSDERALLRPIPPDQVQSDPRRLSVIDVDGRQVATSKTGRETLVPPQTFAAQIPSQTMPALTRDPNRTEKHAFPIAGDDARDRREAFSNAVPREPVEIARPSGISVKALDAIPPATDLIGSAERAANGTLSNVGAKSVPLPQLQASVAAQVGHLSRTPAAAMNAEGTSSPASRMVELELAPADLGRLRLLLHTNERGLHLVVTIERPEMLETVRRHLDGLHRSLVSEGVTLDSVDIGTGGQRRQQEHPAETAAQHETGHSATDRDQPSRGAEPISSVRPPDGRLDLSL